MGTRECDIVVTGAGTAGCYAAATVAEEGLDVVILERKPESEAGHIACGDALKRASTFPDVIPKSQLEPAMTNTDVEYGRFEIPKEDTVLEIPGPDELAVIDRWKYGRLLIEAAIEAGVEIHYDTVVTDVVQDDDNRVSGLEAIRDDDPVTYEAEMVIDAAGSLSLLQDKTDFEGSTFDTNVNYQQFSSAYREIIQLDEPVEWNDALVVKMTERADGYIWYFPRTPTEINAGLGFQMSEPPMQLVEDLKAELRNREEFAGATVTDKLGGALPTRRPYDSAVAPGYVAVGDAAGHVNPTTGAGIAAAAYGASYAAEAAVDAVSNGGPTEEALWEYNERVMDDFGGRYAALDVHNILAMAVDGGQIDSLFAALPDEHIGEAISSGNPSIPIWLKLYTLIRSFGHWQLIYTFYKSTKLADKLRSHYDEYPSSPAELPQWQARRDELMEEVYEVTGAETAKY
jgi:geranylgeranyl reductase family protein